MDLSHIDRLKEEHKKGLELCEGKKEQWEKYKSDYEALIQRLETLPDALSYDITVPFGPNAFTMGNLVHTNEVMVLLGDNWFAKVSAKQAVAIANRRIAQCSRMLADLEKEKEQYQNWLHYMDEMSNDNLVEIVEEYDEEKEKEWREQHSKNVKAYHQKLADEKKHSCTSEEPLTNNSDDEYLSKMEQLELIDDLEQAEFPESDECTKVTNEQKELSESETDISNGTDNSTQVKKNNILGLKLNINEQVINETESGDDDGSKSDDLNSNLENYNSEANAKHVRWQDLSKQKFMKITFKHSKSRLHTPLKHQVKRQSSSESEDSQPLIQSPSDIYKHFGSLFQATSPKSILKVKNSPTTPEENNGFFGSVDEIMRKDNSPDMKDGNIVNAFTGKVFENSSPVHLGDKKSSRPMSHFKSSRKNKKRLSH